MESSFQIRHISPADYRSIIAVLDEWWGGRQMSAMLPKLFFTHFCDTSFIVESDGKVIGFLIGLLSQLIPPKPTFILWVFIPTLGNRGSAVFCIRSFFRRLKRSIVSKLNVSIRR
jgi:hypothetical protein